MAESGFVFDIQRFSTHDGPGIRSTVFLKGCGLRCAWCHNPESWQPVPEMRYYAARCIGCGACAAVCGADACRMEGGLHVYDRTRCIACGRCAKVCPTEAMVRTGRRMDVDEVTREVLRDRAFYDASGGGVTFSGGEPLAQPVFLHALLHAFREEGLHTAVETAGDVQWEDIERILPLTDLFLYDMKCVDDGLHRRLTGGGNARILENLRRLAASGTHPEIRIPVVPGCNDNDAETAAMAELAAALGPGVRVGLLPFHRMAAEKYDSLGLAYGMADTPMPDRERMDRIAAVFSARGVEVYVS
ncbi:MAG: glycyl-radical enzyme activating protein [Clostridia bacterium]|nr:glycyl-radical enzyme activating protein [Clostridia bacterium]